MSQPGFLIRWAPVFHSYFYPSALGSSRPPSPSSSIHPHYLPYVLPSTYHLSINIVYPISFPHTFSSMHPSIIVRYPTSFRAFFHPSIHHHYVPTSSSIHLSSLCTPFFIHPSIIIMYSLLHPSIHPSSLCTHFFIHPSIIIMYPLLHPSIYHHYVPTSSSIHLSSLCIHFFLHPFFHPSIIIIPGRAHPKPGRTGTLDVKIIPGQSG